MSDIVSVNNLIDSIFKVSSFFANTAVFVQKSHIFTHLHFRTFWITTHLELNSLFLLAEHFKNHYMVRIVFVFISLFISQLDVGDVRCLFFFPGYEATEQGITVIQAFVNQQPFRRSEIADALFTAIKYHNMAWSSCSLPCVRVVYGLQLNVSSTCNFMKPRKSG